ncbi:helix-turn-helix domain-containing protein [Streptomyces sp. S1A]|uniref:helix-turn-helix domain-containing protein n=1 Tax=Streptomyces sp. ICN903 TaxID=2964654 RepID=UPI001EDBAC01|nr:helix-turn-helix domain-containing protein [Streptomyces sp. ICN903]MCG3040228.1 helix-turn-helix domain-containing protein [Streptomyces sp. ICN903]
MYEERGSRRVAGAVVWRREAPARPRRARVLPDGCMDLIRTGGGLLVAGPDTRAQLTDDLPGAGYVGLRFPPGTGPRVLGVPAYELRDARVPLEALWPEREVRELAERMAERMAGARSGAAVLEEVSAVRLRRAPDDPLTAAVAAGLRAGVSVAEVARGVGLSERQLHRRSLAAFGYGPKTLARVLRFRRALRLVRGGVPPASAAAGAGYADQAHLSREVRALAGVQLSVLLSEGRPPEG